jgi:hypothetical protein
MNVDATTTPASVPATGPNCDCGMVSVMRVSQKDNANNGRSFFTCPLPQGQSCKFFKWADEVNKPAPARSRVRNAGWTPPKLRKIDSPADSPAPAIKATPPPPGIVNPFLEAWDAKMAMLLSTNIALLTRSVETLTVNVTRLSEEMSGLNKFTVNVNRLSEEIAGLNKTFKEVNAQQQEEGKGSSSEEETVNKQTKH